MTQNNNSWRKTYFTLLAGQAISFISSGILQMAIIFYLVAKTNSAIILTAATLIGFLPQACLGPFAGAFVDRHSRKSVMIGADLIIAAAGGILALVAFYMELPVWSIMVVLLIRSAGTAFHSPAFSAATPMIVPKRGTYKMRWLHADHASSKCDYQVQLPQRFYMLFGLLMQLYC